MKLVLALFTLWSGSVLAAETCSTAWVYQPYKTCRHADHGLDTSTTGEYAGLAPEWSDWVLGDTDQRRLCQRIANEFSRKSMRQGLLGSLVQPTPVDETSKKRGSVML